jgi:outer membrane protein
MMNDLKRKFLYIFLTGIITSAFSSPAHAQITDKDTVLQDATLQNCIQYALKHYPLVQQSLLNEEITEQQIKSKLSEWYPQINLNANYLHYFQLQAVSFNNAISFSGTNNVSTVGFGLTQNIFNRDVLLASSSANDVRRQSKQNTVSNKIDVVANVSKAFYDVLLTQQQIALLDDDIVRLERNLKDAYNQYRGGIVDKTDYKTATITLNNSKAERKSGMELLKAKMAYLKQQMGYLAANEINIIYDSTQMEREAFIDTNQTVNYNNRIEYQLLQTQKSLQTDNLKYNKWSYIPTISAIGNYNLNYLNNDFPPLYSNNFPTSNLGLQISFPIFQGGKRTHDIRTAELQLKSVDWDITSLETNINSQYSQAMATYKSNLIDYYALKENLDLAREVYNTVELQYRSGIKAYLDVITAETNLRTTQVNYTNSLYQLLSSKIDVQRSLGTITNQ